MPDVFESVGPGIEACSNRFSVGDSMVSNKLLKQLWAIAPPAFDSGQRAWELGLPAICRAPAVEADGAAGQVHRVNRLCWRFAPDRRQANSHALRAEAGGHLSSCGQKQSTPVAPPASDSGRKPWQILWFQTPSSSSFGLLRRLPLILARGRGS